jgi:L-cysteine/cystine lyase
VNAAALRGRFPVLERLAYLNAGTDGPLPAVAAEAARAELDRQVQDGRWQAHFERRSELNAGLRERYAGLLGRPADEVALTTSTSEGLATALAGMKLGRGDEVLTSDEEHPGLIGPLIAVRQRGVEVRAVPFAELANEVRPDTRLVACSHVSWVSGAHAPRELAEVDPPVILDGAQGVGAVPVDPEALGCAVYAGSGQKWMCGPDGTGMLWVSPEWRGRIAPTRPAYMGLADPPRGLDSPLREDCRAFDTPSLSAETVASATAAFDVLAEAGWDAVHARGAELARQLADELRERGHEVRDRDATTLVAWACDDTDAAKRALAERGVVVRDLPGRGLLRASVGAWNDEADLDRLLAGLASFAAV